MALSDDSCLYRKPDMLQRILTGRDWTTCGSWCVCCTTQEIIMNGNGNSSLKPSRIMCFCHNFCAKVCTLKRLLSCQWSMIVIMLVHFCSLFHDWDEGKEWLRIGPCYWYLVVHYGYLNWLPNVTHYQLCCAAVTSCLGVLCISYTHILWVAFAQSFVFVDFSDFLYRALQGVC